MKIFAFSDTHGKTDFSEYTDYATRADIVLVVGDITIFGHDVHKVLKGLSALGKQANKPIIITHGNHEEHVLEDLEAYDNLVYLHLAAMHTNNATILGYGGGGFSQMDPQFLAFMQAAYKDDMKNTVIWIMHGPPHGVGLDEVPGWGPTGCMSKRAAIEVHEPTLVVCGHIHEGEGQHTRIGNTLIINVGEEGLWVDLEQGTVHKPKKPHS